LQIDEHSHDGEEGLYFVVDSFTVTGIDPVKLFIVEAGVPD
jgi:hypothetical protein